MKVCVADVPGIIVIRAVTEIRLDIPCGYNLRGHIGEKPLLDLIPIDKRQCLVLLVFPHEGAEEGGDLPDQRHGDQGQSRGKPGLDHLKLRRFLRWGDKFPLFQLAHLIELSVSGGDETDHFVRLPGLLQRLTVGFVRRENALSLHDNLGSHQAVRILVLGLFQGLQELAGPLNALLHSGDGRPLGVLDFLSDAAVFH